MYQKTPKLPISNLDELYTAGAGFDILRYVALPEFLGEEAPTLLYFMGRNLARKFEINTIEDVYYIFEKLGVGKLELVKEKKHEKIFHLLADSVFLRLKSSVQADFRLEAGFLAEAMEAVDGVECECVEDINHRIHQVQFSVINTK
ncbi:YslB family protein [Oceanobacillus sp. FSL H7-0719]|uniref:YslB family protein n=1 Tax=Oceanobacillus sp. FSL H7-0719 TaxID=2954507 RepID=UPI00324B625A